jgi:hypothetical protein
MQQPNSTKTRRPKRVFFTLTPPLLTDELTVAKGIPPELTFARKFSHTGATVTYLRKLRRDDAFACVVRMTGKENAAAAFKN